MLRIHYFLTLTDFGKSDIKSHIVNNSSCYAIKGSKKFRYIIIWFTYVNNCCYFCRKFLHTVLASTLSHLVELLPTKKETQKTNKLKKEMSNVYSLYWDEF